MLTFGTIVSVLAMSFVGFRLRQLHHLTRHTSANPALVWAAIAVVLMIASGIFRSQFAVLPNKMISAIQYLATVMMLTPMVHILGARRPGVAAWPWFVVLPLIVVLQWPSVSQLFSGRWTDYIEIPSPTFTGFFFVLLMAGGNYVGTSVTATAILGSAGIILCALPVTDWMAFDNAWAFPLGCSLLAVAALILPGRLTQPQTTPKTNTSLQLLWQQFRDIYGLVWARRVADRVNQFAERERWNVRLSLDGFVPYNVQTEAISSNGVIQPLSDDQIPDRCVDVMAWVLRRFVDAEFFQRHLPDHLATVAINAVQRP